MPKIQKKKKIEQCTKIFIYRDLKWSNELILHLLIVMFIIVNFSKLEQWKKVSTDYFNVINNGNKECLELVSSPPLFRPILFNFLNLQIQDVLLGSIF